jgi:hypothetical protein
VYEVDASFLICMADAYGAQSSEMLLKALMCICNTKKNTLTEGAESVKIDLPKGLTRVLKLRFR